MRVLAVVLIFIVGYGCSSDEAKKCYLSQLTYTVDGPGTDNDFSSVSTINYESGIPVSIDEHYSDGSFGVYTINYTGNTITSINYKETTIDGTSESKFEFTLEGKFVTEKKRFVLSNGTYALKSHETYTYNDLNQLSVRESYSSTNSLIQRQEYTYSDTSPNPSSVLIMPFGQVASGRVEVYTYTNKSPSLNEYARLTGFVALTTREVSSVTITDNTDNETVVGYTGLYRSDGLAEKQTRTYPDGTTYTYAFEYDCH